VLLDLSMPELDGLEVIARLRKTRPALRIAVLTGHAAPDVERRARELGAHEFIVKGTPPGEIVARLRAATGGE
jgi:two-component system response regulator DesR